MSSKSDVFYGHCSLLLSLPIPFGPSIGPSIGPPPPHFHFIYFSTHPPSSELFLVCNDIMHVIIADFETIGT